MRLKYHSCGYNWLFKSRKPSYLLKHTYWVRCPECDKRVWKRVKRKIKKMKK